MGKVVVSQFISLDGVVEDPGGAEEFDRGGWAFEFDRGPEGNKFKLDEVMASDALLLRRVTYEGFAAAWPSRSGDFPLDLFRPYVEGGNGYRRAKTPRVQRRGEEEAEYLHEDALGENNGAEETP